MNWRCFNMAYHIMLAVHNLVENDRELSFVSAWLKNLSMKVAFTNNLFSFSILRVERKEKSHLRSVTFSNKEADSKGVWISIVGLFVTLFPTVFYLILVRSCLNHSYIWVGGGTLCFCVNYFQSYTLTKSSLILSSVVFHLLSITIHEFQFIIQEFFLFIIHEYLFD